MTADEFALLQAVRENPAADTPRLVYADYLEERGDDASAARAEYIRLECELARLSDDDAVRQPMQSRSNELFQTHGATWWREMEQRIQVTYPDLRFRAPPDGDLEALTFDRGFVAGIHVSWNTLRTHPGLAPLIGPIEYLAVTIPDGEPLKVDRLSENWNTRRLKILELRSRSMTFDELLTRHGVQCARSGDTLVTVPILRLVTSNPNRAIPADVAGYVMNGQMNPVVLFGVVHGIPSLHTVVADPLNLWPKLKPWAERYVGSTWHFRGIEILPHHLQSIPSTRLPHLVRYYQLAGLPPPSPTAERVTTAAPPKRGILTRAARWFRGRG